MVTTVARLAARALGGVTIIVVLSVLVLEIRLSSIRPYDFAPQAGTLWAHRGSWGDSVPMQNTIQAVRRARDAGYTGVELDVYFNDRGFVVRHDPPFSDSTPLLEDFLREFGPGLCYWIDFKNLTGSNAEHAASEMGRLADKYGVRKRIIVESLYPGPLATFRDLLGDVKVLYWIGEFPDGGEWLRRRLYHRYTVAWYRFRAVSIDAGFAGETFNEAFGQLTRAVFVVNDRARIEELRTKGFQIVLTDLPKSGD